MNSYLGFCWVGISRFLVIFVFKNCIFWPASTFEMTILTQMTKGLDSPALMQHLKVITPIQVAGFPPRWTTSQLASASASQTQCWHLPLSVWSALSGWRPWASLTEMRNWLDVQIMNKSVAEHDALLKLNLRPQDFTLPSLLKRVIILFLLPFDTATFFRL